MRVATGAAPTMSAAAFGDMSFLLRFCMVVASCFGNAFNPKSWSSLRSRPFSKDSSNAAKAPLLPSFAP